VTKCTTNAFLFLFAVNPWAKGCSNAGFDANPQGPRVDHARRQWSAIAAGTQAFNLDQPNADGPITMFTFYDHHFLATLVFVCVHEFSVFCGLLRCYHTPTPAYKTGSSDRSSTNVSLTNIRTPFAHREAVWIRPRRLAAPTVTDTVLSASPRRRHGSLPLCGRDDC